MAHLFDNAHDEPEQRHAPRRPRWVWAAGIGGLAILGIACAVLWRAWDDTLSFPSFASVAAPGAGPAVAPAEVADKPVGSKEFRAAQQQVAGSLQSTAQLVAAQQAEIKRLSDQVSALTARIDALQNPAASAQAAVPPPPPPPAARKKPVAAPKQPAGISVGGAPLPPPAGR